MSNQRNIPAPGITDGYRYIWNQAKSGWQKYGGQIMTIAGTVGLFGAGIHACRKTYKIHKKLEENGKKLSAAKAYLDGEGKLKHAGRMIKETVKVAAKTSCDYIPEIIAGGVSAYAVHKGWHKEHANYQQTAAMLGVVMADFMNYRGNVIDEQGADADRRYLTTKNKKAYLAEKPKKSEETNEETTQDDAHVIQLSENDLRIWYSRETTPDRWSDSLAIRIGELRTITEQLTRDLIWGGSYTINDVRREFYGRKGDIGNGGMFGRIWDPGDPEHPERGKLVNLHFEEDEDFMTGRTEGCWIIIDIDNEPLFELMARKRDRELAGDIR